MAPPKRPKTKTASRCSSVTVRATHAFEVADYSLHKGLGAGNFITSATFPVGGNDWCIRYYPDGDIEENCRDYVSVYLELLTKNAEVRALFDLRLANPATGRSSSVCSQLTSPSVFHDVNMVWGTRCFKKRSELEASAYLQDDRLVIECDVTVIKEPLVVETVLTSEIFIQVPPSDLLDNLGELLETEEEADVAFKVKGEVFHAHKIVLAMRSPVFKAELYGPMRDRRRRSIAIEDMQPAVFKALLHFIYTDSLPSMHDLDDDENEEMVKHLLVAADRYAMERMKLMCESILSKSLDVDSVATTLALADQHHCNELKDACVEFILSSNRIDDVVESQGYEHLKRACPAVFVDIWEKAAKSRKI